MIWQVCSQTYEFTTTVFMWAFSLRVQAILLKPVCKEKTMRIIFVRGYDIFFFFLLPDAASICLQGMVQSYIHYLDISALSMII